MDMEEEGEMMDAEEDDGEVSVSITTVMNDPPEEEAESAAAIKYTSAVVTGLLVAAGVVAL